MHEMKLILIILVSIESLKAYSPYEMNNEVESRAQNAKKTFMYFAYGSNMFSKRIHRNNPTAVQRYIGILKNHRLDFIYQSDGWGGAPSTIVPHQNAEVWGVVWELNFSDLPNLDKQEGVPENEYFPKTVKILTSKGKRIKCRTYQQTKTPDYVHPSQLPPERQPSLIYLNTIIKGAEEFNLPEHYVQYLKSFRHNNYTGEVTVPRSIYYYD